MKTQPISDGAAPAPGPADLAKTSVAFWLVALIAAGIIFIGLRFLVQPLPAAAAFGVSADGSSNFAYLWAKGTRDIVSGLLLIALLGIHAGRRVVALFLAVAALIPLGDLANVWMNVGTQRPVALAIHGSTVVGMLVLSGWLFRRPRPVESDGVTHAALRAAAPPREAPAHR